MHAQIQERLRLQKGIKTEVSMNLKCRFEATVFIEGFIYMLIILEWAQSK